MLRYVRQIKPCLVTKCDGGLLRIHEADEAAINWQTTYGSEHTLIIIVTLYDIRPGNGAGLFLQPRSPHGATGGTIPK